MGVADTGYTAEMSVDLTGLGYPSGLGDGTLWAGVEHLDGDSFGSNWNLSYGNTPAVRRHWLVFNYVYELPFGRKARGVTRAVLGGWQVAGISTYGTGTPFSVNFTSRAKRSSLTLCASIASM